MLTLNDVAQAIEKIRLSRFFSLFSDDQYVLPLKEFLKKHSKLDQFSPLTRELLVELKPLLDENNRNLWSDYAREVISEILDPYNKLYTRFQAIDFIESLDSTLNTPIMLSFLLENDALSECHRNAAEHNFPWIIRELEGLDYSAWYTEKSLVDRVNICDKYTHDICVLNSMDRYQVLNISGMQKFLFIFRFLVDKSMLPIALYIADGNQEEFFGRKMGCYPLMGCGDELSIFIKMSIFGAPNSNTAKIAIKFDDLLKTHPAIGDNLRLNFKTLESLSELTMENVLKAIDSSPVVSSLPSISQAQHHLLQAEAPSSRTTSVPPSASILSHSMSHAGIILAPVPSVSEIAEQNYLSQSASRRPAQMQSK